MPQKALAVLEMAARARIVAKLFILVFEEVYKFRNTRVRNEKGQRRWGT